MIPRVLFDDDHRYFGICLFLDLLICSQDMHVVITVPFLWLRYLDTLLCALMSRNLMMTLQHADFALTLDAECISPLEHS